MRAFHKAAGMAASKPAVITMTLVATLMMAAAIWSTTWAHPEHPEDRLNISVSPDPVRLGETLEITGEDIAPESNFRIYIVLSPENDECRDQLAGAVRLDTTGEETDAAGTFEYEWLVTETVVGEATEGLACVVDGDGTVTEHGPTFGIGTLPTIRLNKADAYAGETIRISGENFSGGTEARFFVVKAPEGEDPVEWEPDCGDELDANRQVGPIVRQRVRTDGTVQANYVMTEADHYTALQWWVCGYDSAGEWHAEHLHVNRILRASVTDKFQSQEILLLDEENSLEVIPGIPSTVDVETITINGAAITSSGRTDTGAFKTSLTISPSSDAFSPGAAAVIVSVSEPLGDRNQISGSFSIRGEFERGVQIYGPAEAYPGETIVVSGEQWAPRRNGVIFVLPWDDLTEDDSDPPQKHVSELQRRQPRHGSEREGQRGRNRAGERAAPGGEQVHSRGRVGAVRSRRIRQPHNAGDAGNQIHRESGRLDRGRPHQGTAERAENNTAARGR